MPACCTHADEPLDETEEEGGSGSGSEGGGSMQDMQRRLAAAGGASAGVLGSMPPADSSGARGGAPAAARAASAASAAGQRQAAEGGAGPAVEEEAAQPRRAYPPLPARSYALPELLRMAGLGETADEAEALGLGGLLIRDLVTCNSQQAGPGALYVCVPSNDTEGDGHEYVAEVRGPPAPVCQGRACGMESTEEARMVWGSAAVRLRTGTKDRRRRVEEAGSEWWCM